MRQFHRKVCSFGAVVLLCGFLAGLAIPALADDAKELQGTWVAVKAELSGIPIVDVGTITLTIENENYVVSVNGKLDQGTCKIDAAARPGKMTITGGKEGPNAGKTFLAIYELQGDMLRVCYDLSGKKSPEEFATRQGAPLYLVSYQRKK